MLADGQICRCDGGSLTAKEKLRTFKQTRTSHKKIMRSRQRSSQISELLAADQTPQRVSELLCSGSHLKIRTGSFGRRRLGASRSLFRFSGQVLQHDALLQQKAPEG